MTGTWMVVLFALIALAPTSRGDTHANPIFAELTRGVAVDGITIKLPPPSLSDDEAAE